MNKQHGPAAAWRWGAGDTGHREGGGTQCLLCLGLHWQAFRSPEICDKAWTNEDTLNSEELRLHLNKLEKNTSMEPDGTPHPFCDSVNYVIYLQ